MSSYIDQLLKQIADLRVLHANAERDPSVDRVASRLEATTSSIYEEETSQNPMLQAEPWFAKIKSSNAPIWIGEASDSAFATRFRQFASRDPQSEAHIPRTHYVTDAMLASLAQSKKHTQWPSLSRASFLIEVALRQICRCYHIVRRSEVMASMTLLGKEHNVSRQDSVAECRLWALLAHGELYSTKMATTEDFFPGLRYFSKASDLLQLVSERPQLEVVETMLLLVCDFSCAKRLSDLQIKKVAILSQCQSATCSVYSGGLGHPARNHNGSPSQH